MQSFDKRTTEENSTDGGIETLIVAAADRRRDEGFTHLLEGDLSQMSAQKKFLRGEGFEVGQNDVYPALRDEETFLRAIKLIFEHRVEGWWNYERKLVEHGICTQPEFDAAIARASA
jgi:hypothetical protein